jgi:hypothetical protein
MGNKNTKEKRKGKANDDYPMGTVSHDDIHLYHDTHELRASSHEKVAEVHLRLLKEKLEMENRKQRMKMSRTYKEVPMADTALLDGFQRMEHRRALNYFSDILFWRKE